MAYEVPSTGSILNFPENSPYHGLTVKLDEPPIGLLTTVMENYSKFTTGNVSPEEAARLITVLVDSFASVLEEWDAQKKGVPVPATPEGVKSLGAAFVMGLIGAWVTGTTSVDEDGDLGKGSVSGGTSPEELAQMAALSSSLPSSGPQSF